MHEEFCGTTKLSAPQCSQSCFSRRLQTQGYRGCIHSAVIVNTGPPGRPAPRLPIASRKGSSCTCRACRRPSFRYRRCPLGSRPQGHCPMAQLQCKYESGHLHIALAHNQLCKGSSRCPNSRARAALHIPEKQGLLIIRNSVACDIREGLNFCCSAPWGLSFCSLTRKQGSQACSSPDLLLMQDKGNLSRPWLKSIQFQ